MDPVLTAVVGGDAEQVGALHAAQVRRPVHEVVEVRGPGPLQEVAGHVDGQVLPPADRADPLRALPVPHDLGVAEPLGVVDLLGRDGAVCVGVGDDRVGAGGEALAVARPVQVLLLVARLAPGGPRGQDDERARPEAGGVLLVDDGGPGPHRHAVLHGDGDPVAAEGDQVLGGAHVPAAGAGIGPGVQVVQARRAVEDDGALPVAQPAARRGHVEARAQALPGPRPRARGAARAQRSRGAQAGQRGHDGAARDPRPLRARPLRRAPRLRRFR